MSDKNLRNIVVLKNLPSNLVDEAIVILKSKNTARKLELIENNIVKKRNTNTNTSDYVIKEAENVISNYINKMEKNKKFKKSNNNIETKYRKMKKYSIFISIMLLLCLIRIIFWNKVLWYNKWRKENWNNKQNQWW